MASRLVVTEDELHAYLDDALPVPRRLMVWAYLAVNASDAARLRAYRGDGRAIARVFGGFDLADLPVSRPTAIDA